MSTAEAQPQAQDTGWDASAAAWIADMDGDAEFSRRFILDAPMLARIAGRGFRNAIDIGCGEGRFCRMMADIGLATTGIDPSQALITAAKNRHPSGDYHLERAEALGFPDASFDLVVSYLTLIDIADFGLAIAEMVRVLAPGGSLLIANLNGYHTAWSARANNADTGYFDEFATWEEWRGIRVRNWHRPLARYMQLLLGHGLLLRHFDEPAPTGGDAAKQRRYRQLPQHHLMEWQKPLG